MVRSFLHQPLRSIAGITLALALTASTASVPARAESEAEPISGLASYYSTLFHGRRTASGERFDMEALTAAHRTLPFGTRVRVTNLNNGREVVVRINDRGPFKKGRVIDVSRAAAEQLGLLSAGVGRVSLEVLS